MNMPDLGGLYIALQFLGVAVSAAAGALAGRGRRVDLFGVVVLAIVTALGGGTLRDLCLGATPVFWLKDWRYAGLSVLAGMATFWGIRYLVPRLRALELADAFALALFTVVGAEKSLALGANGFSAVVLGTMTGVAGGVLRDVLLNELPLVFRPEIRLYATASVAGAAVFVWVRQEIPQAGWPLLAGAMTTLGLRLAAMRWELSLPVLEDPGPSGRDQG
jgi:uncharacterized membrane protein YeiH